MIAELLIEGVRVNTPVILISAHHAAADSVAEAVELLGVRNRQGFEHYRVNQGEDGRVRADAQCERQHRHSGEAGILCQQAQAKL